MLVKTLTVLILAMPLFSPFAEPKNVKLHNNVKQMKEEVLAQIPIESSIGHAQEVMEKSGFECEMVWNKSFGDYDEQGNPIPPPLALPQIGGKRVDFLFCDKEKAAFPYIFPVTRRWQIAIVHKHGIVTEIRVAISLTGP